MQTTPLPRFSKSALTALRLRPFIMQIGGHTTMGEQSIPYVGFECRVGEVTFSIRLYPHGRVLRTQGRRHVTAFPKISGLETLESIFADRRSILESTLERAEAGAKESGQ